MVQNKSVIVHVFYCLVLLSSICLHSYMLEKNKEEIDQLADDLTSLKKLNNDKILKLESEIELKDDEIELRDGEIELKDEEIEKISDEKEELNDNLLKIEDEITEKDKEINSLNEKLKKQLTSQSEKSNEIVHLSNDNDNSNTVKVEATHYTAKCDGCSGITATGIDVRDSIYYEGMRIIAVDPEIIPLNSIVQVTYPDGTTFKAIALDTGGAINNNKIDILVETKSEAYQLGRQSVTVKIL